ncbi:MAG: XdhC family protein [Ferruginibacter sp.]
MNLHRDCWRLALSSLQYKIPVMLLYVLESRGSSPGRQGFFMIVNLQKEMCGSIGGGVMEHKFVELALQRLQEDSEFNKIYRQVHDKKEPVEQSGMICSGEQTILIQRLNSSAISHIEHLLISRKDNGNGCLQLDNSGLSFSDEIPMLKFSFHQEQETFTYREKTGITDYLHIIGGGHCSLALSAIMAGLGFCVEIYDDRPGLNTLEYNTTADEKHQVSSYSELKIMPGPDVYVVIMTFGYRTDDIALRALVGKSYKYLGLLGSKNKIATMMQVYSQEGIDAPWLEQIHAPAGLSIHSQTPEEIAISIAAEIISVKNRPQ